VTAEPLLSTLLLTSTLFQTALLPCFSMCCSYNLHDRGHLWQDVKDQSQPIAIDLLSLAGNAICKCPGLPRVPYLAQHTALKICKLYQDPEAQWVSG
jgi:hypothetical protein